LLKALQDNSAQAKDKLRARYDDVDASAIFNDWINALEVMIDHARRRESCSWIAPISETEALNAERKLRGGMRSFGLDPDKEQQG
jgi:hypothetical protein